MKMRRYIITIYKKESTAMITMEALNTFGAKTEEGLARCLGEESFYLTLVDSAITDEQIKVLIGQIKEGNLEAAFETSHALKGIYANLSLTPLYDTVYKLTEHLRAKEQMDYTPLTGTLLSNMQELMKLAGK